MLMIEKNLGVFVYNFVFFIFILILFSLRALYFFNKPYISLINPGHLYLSTPSMGEKTNFNIKFFFCNAVN